MSFGIRMAKGAGTIFDDPSSSSKTVSRLSWGHGKLFLKVVRPFIMADHHGSAFPAEEVSQLNRFIDPWLTDSTKRESCLLPYPNYDPATKSAQSVTDRSTLRLK